MREPKHRRRGGELFQGLGLVTRMHHAKVILFRKTNYFSIELGFSPFLKQNPIKKIQKITKNKKMGVVSLFFRVVSISQKDVTWQEFPIASSNSSSQTGKTERRRCRGSVNKRRKGSKYMIERESFYYCGITRRCNFERNYQNRVNEDKLTGLLAK